MNRDQYLAAERIIQNLDERLSETQFVALCAALQLTDNAAIEWALDELSLYGLLIDERPYYRFVVVP